ncbi:MAG TPA: hypothetical protein VI457_06695 [Methylococcaceae bacterium]|nr:hypothetical protein [Methylococcaceae bacterium]
MGQIILKTAVDTDVGANLFALSTAYGRINSPLQFSRKLLKMHGFTNHLPFLGSF